MKKVIAVIPARYESSRFPGKPLALIAGKPMIQRVYEQVKKVDGIAEVLVATDDERIAKCVEAFGGIYAMTGECSCGTERVYEAIKDYDCDIVLNVQGDEPFIQPDMIKQVVEAFDESTPMATLCKKIDTEEERINPNVVKVVRDRLENALYFSRYPIPYNRDDRSDVAYYKHIGIYGYTKEFLEKYVTLMPTPLERSESLEQLRVLENGYSIKVKETTYESYGVDTPEDLAVVEKMIVECNGE